MAGRSATSRRDYRQHKARAADRSATMSREGRDIGAIPAVVDPVRLAAAERSFRAFCDSYFPSKFTLPWSTDHLKVIGRIEQVVNENGRFAVAMPRASGKTSLCEVAVLWALLTGLHSFVFLIGSTADHAATMLSNLKTELSTNDLLLADFPAVCFPIRCLEGEARRCSGQLHHGRPTHVGWTADEVVLPSIPGSRASGSLVRVAGITGNIRGALHTRPDGTSVRPTLAILDDPQTDESARSMSQCASRLATINGAVAGLAGPGKRVGMIVPCTVICEGDLADRLLDREQSPDWAGERFRLVYRFPTATKLWEQYAELRVHSLQQGGDGHEATEFYRQHRAEMDAGAVVAWPKRHLPDELSAIQHAMNLKLQDERAFFAEYQNEPLKLITDLDAEQLDVDQVLAKVSGVPRGEVPVGCDHLAAFIDIQQSSLWWVVMGWGSGFTGAVIDYGVWPEQGQQYFTLRHVQRTLQTASPDSGIEAAIYHGLSELTSQLLDREWMRADGTVLRVARCLIDANWGTSTDTVYHFARQCRHPTIVMPSHGRPVGASTTSMAEWPRRPGDLYGLNWRVRTGQNRAVRHVVFDTYFWKTFVQSHFAIPAGDKGAITLFHGSPAQHRMFAEHLTSEYRVRVEGRGRVVDEWKLKPGRDNHFFDGVVGCAVAASMLGVTAIGESTTPNLRPRRPRRQSQVTF